MEPKDGGGPGGPQTGGFLDPGMAALIAALLSGGVGFYGYSKSDEKARADAFTKALGENAEAELKTLREKAASASTYEETIKRQGDEVMRLKGEVERLAREKKAAMETVSGPSLAFKNASPEVLRAAIPGTIAALNTPTYAHLMDTDAKRKKLEKVLEYPTTYQGRLARMSLLDFYTKQVKPILEANAAPSGGRRRRGRRQRGGKTVGEQRAEIAAANREALERKAKKEQEAKEAEEAAKRQAAEEAAKKQAAEEAERQAAEAAATTGMNAELAALEGDTSSPTPVTGSPPPGSAGLYAMKPVPEYDEFAKLYTDAIAAVSQKLKSETLSAREAEDQRAKDYRKNIDQAKQTAKDAKKNKIAREAAEALARKILKAIEAAEKESTKQQADYDRISATDTSIVDAKRQLDASLQEGKLVADPSNQSAPDKSLWMTQGTGELPFQLAPGQQITIEESPLAWVESWDSKKSDAERVLKELGERTKAFAEAMKTAKKNEKKPVKAAAAVPPPAAEATVPPPAAQTTVPPPAAEATVPPPAAQTTIPPPAATEPVVPPKGTSSWTSWFKKNVPEKAPEAKKNDTIHQQLLKEPGETLKALKANTKAFKKVRDAALAARNSLCTGAGGLMDYKGGPELYEKITLNLQEADRHLDSAETLQLLFDTFIKDYKKTTKGLKFVADSSFVLTPEEEAAKVEKETRRLEELAKNLRNEESRRLAEQEKQGKIWAIKEAARKIAEAAEAAGVPPPPPPPPPRELTEAERKREEADKADEEKRLQANAEKLRVVQEKLAIAKARKEGESRLSEASPEAMTRGREAARAAALEAFLRSGQSGGALAELVKLRERFEDLSLRTTAVQADMNASQTILEKTTADMDAADRAGPMTPEQRAVEDNERATRARFRTTPLPTECFPYQFVPPPPSETLPPPPPPPPGLPPPPPPPGTGAEVGLQFLPGPKELKRGESAFLGPENPLLKGRLEAKKKEEEKGIELTSLPPSQTSTPATSNPSTPKTMQSFEIEQGDDFDAILKSSDVKEALGVVVVGGQEVNSVLRSILWKIKAPPSPTDLREGLDELFGMYASWWEMNRRNLTTDIVNALDIVIDKLKSEDSRKTAAALRAEVEEAGIRSDGRRRTEKAAYEKRRQEFFANAADPNDTTVTRIEPSDFIKLPKAAQALWRIQEDTIKPGEGAYKQAEMKGLPDPQPTKDIYYVRKSPATRPQDRAPGPENEITPVSLYPPNPLTSKQTRQSLAKQGSKVFKGSSRKSTLKKRRGGKQNGRRTRRGKNRANRSHSHAR